MYLVFSPCLSLFFFFNDTATTEIYTLSLHDALPICLGRVPLGNLIALVASRRGQVGRNFERRGLFFGLVLDFRGIEQRAAPCSIPRKSRGRKSTRLNSRHLGNSSALFCFKKKKKTTV